MNAHHLIIGYRPRSGDNLSFMCMVRGAGFSRVWGRHFPYGKWNKWRKYREKKSRYRYPSRSIFYFSILITGGTTITVQLVAAANSLWWLTFFASATSTPSGSSRKRRPSGAHAIVCMGWFFGGTNPLQVWLSTVGSTNQVVNDTNNQPIETKRTKPINQWTKRIEPIDLSTRPNVRNNQSNQPN